METLKLGRSVILFVIRRSDAKLFRPNKTSDPSFTQALIEAAYKGVEVYAYDVNIDFSRIFFNRHVSVDLEN